MNQGNGEPCLAIHRNSGSERESGSWTAFFGFKLAGATFREQMASRGGYWGVQRDWLAVLAGLENGGDLWASSLRYWSKPPTAELPFGRMEVAALTRVRGRTREEAKKLAAALFQDCALALPTYGGGYEFTALEEAAELRGWLEVSSFKHAATLRRRRELVPVEGAPCFYMVYPFRSSGSDWSRLLHVLLAWDHEVILDVAISPTQLRKEEEAALRRHITERDKEIPRRITVDLMARMLDTCYYNARGWEEGNLLQMRILVASPKPLPAALLQILGNEITLPAGAPPDGGGPPLSGGFEVWTPRNEADRARAAKDVQDLEFDTTRVGDAPAGLERLAHLFVPTEALNAFRLPIPREGGVPGLPLNPFVAAPAPDNVPTVGLCLGQNVVGSFSLPIFISPRDRSEHFYVVGKTGTGKSTLLLNMMIQDLQQGCGLACLDPHGDLIENLLPAIPDNRLEDVILFDPSDREYPMGLNLLEWKTPGQKDFLVQEAVNIFFKLFDPNRQGIVGPQWEHWFRNAALTLMAAPEGGTIIEIPKLFIDDDFRGRKILHVEDPTVKDFWDKQLAVTAQSQKSEMLNYFVSKFGRFGSNLMMRHITGQSRSAFDFRNVMDSGKILLVNLSKGALGEVNSDLLGMIVVAKLHAAAMGRTEVPRRKRRPFYLYVDEFQSFTTDTFAAILSEARKYRLHLTLAHQFTHQLSFAIRHAVFGNVGTMVAFRVGTQDAELLQYEFDRVFRLDDLKGLPNYHAAMRMLVKGEPCRSFSLRTAFPDVSENSDKVEAIRSRSRNKYALPLAQVEPTIAKRFGAIESESPSGEGDSVRDRAQPLPKRRRKS